MYYELGHHEKEVMFEDQGTITSHYYEHMQSIEECKAYIDMADLNETHKTALGIGSVVHYICPINEEHVPVGGVINNISDIIVFEYPYLPRVFCLYRH